MPDLTIDVERSARVQDVDPMYGVATVPAKTNL
jgi:hypothetical protein